MVGDNPLDTCLCVCPSRGGVLEPEGTVEIKFRRKDLDKVMRRLDPQLKQMSDQAFGSDVTPEKRAELQKKMKELEDKLAPSYHMVALMFADLHDTPGRMEEKGVISVREHRFVVVMLVYVLLFVFRLWTSPPTGHWGCVLKEIKLAP